MVLTLEEFMAGWISVGGILASHPLDTLKVRSQKVHAPILETFKYLVKHDGFMGLYKGATLPTFMSGFSNALFFGAYANSYRSIMDYYKQKNLHIDPFWPMCIAGSCGGVAQTILTVPVENIKIQFQMHDGRQQIGQNIIKGPPLRYSDCVIRMYNTYGLLGFYRGVLPTIIRDVPTGGIYVCLYVYGDKWLKKYVSEYWSHLIAGGMAGTISFAPAIPVDVIKTLLQADDLKHPKYKGFMDCIRQTLEKHGASAFWRGFTTNSIRAFVNNAFVFMIYELYLDYFSHKPTL